MKQCSPAKLLSFMVRSRCDKHLLYIVSFTSRFNSSLIVGSLEIIGKYPTSLRFLILKLNLMFKRVARIGWHDNPEEKEKRRTTLEATWNQVRHVCGSYLWQSLESCHCKAAKQQQRLVHFHALAVCRTTPITGLGMAHRTP